MITTSTGYHKAAVRIGALCLLWAVLTATIAWGQGAAAPADEIATDKNQKESVFSLVKKGGPVMIPLALCSVLGLAIAIERFLSLKREKMLPTGFSEGLRSALTGNIEEARQTGIAYCQTHEAPVASIFEAGFRKLGRGDEAVEKAVEDAGAREVDKLKRSLRPLSVIATVSPLLGLLGTVYGMIGAFQTATQVGMGKADVLGKGIYEALVTTATGLTIAIPILLIYQYLNTRVDSLVDEIDDMGIHFMQWVDDHADTVNGASA